MVHFPLVKFRKTAVVNFASYRRSLITF